MEWAKVEKNTPGSVEGVGPDEKTEEKSKAKTKTETSSADNDDDDNGSGGGFIKKKLSKFF